jgi:threonyl-tRNA synthetase
MRGFFVSSAKSLRKFKEANLEGGIMLDHVEIGKELDLFIQSPIVGKGLPLLTENGTVIKRELIRYVEDLEISLGYKHSSTPVMGSKELFSISGHWSKYKEYMFHFDVSEDDVYALRPMTCPYHFQLYLRKLHSYRELPVRYAETAVLFRNEATGAIHGLNRIRQFTLSDGHIICREDQIEDEFMKALDLVKMIMDRLKIDDFWFRFSTHDPKNMEKYISTPSAWKSSEKLLKQILEKNELNYEDGPGEAAFYGPKLDVQLIDSLGREETLFTLQLDFALPERFGMSYIDEANQKVTPFVIHRSSIGCYERTIAHLLERTQGVLPFWLSPQQIAILPLSDSFIDYAFSVQKVLQDKGFRSIVDSSQETLGKRIRLASKKKIPVICVVGEKETESGSINVRLRNSKDTTDWSLDQLVSYCVSEKTS